ncbi:MAG TPA: GNAT family N-acetyltransferase [Syntrophales bacterium]|nr:GNAT family N-acetyltransferase [Syntrophales bacterium]
MHSSAMQVHYAFITEPAASQVEEVLALYRIQGWWGPSSERDPETAGAIIRGSHCFVVAEADGRVIGMGRAISDGVSDAYIQDVVVDPAFRGRGIGGRIVADLVHRLRQDGIGWIGLGAEAGTHDFYRRAGFTELPGCIVMLKKDP